MSALGTVEKALDILQHLHSAGAPRGVSEIGRALDLPKATAHRLLAALGRRGMVERSADGRYRPGIALVALGVGILEREPVVSAAEPVMEELAETLEQTIFLAGARGSRLYVLAKREGSGFLRAAPRVGERIPVHATAIGKLYMAFAPEQVTDPGAAAQRFTDATLSPTALERELATIRAEALAENHDEWIEGLSGVAAPIRLRERIAGAIAVTGPSARFEPAQRARIREQISRAARQIGERLAGGPGENGGNEQ
ncbi:MAG: IclR family transcriptional regulator [bacterium]|nr:IclR family transcriptional regulator [bacterium]